MTMNLNTEEEEQVTRSLRTVDWELRQYSWSNEPEPVEIRSSSSSRSYIRNSYFFWNFGKI